MFRKAAIAALLLPAAAHGQTTNTTCFRNGQYVDCTSVVQPAPGGPTDYLRLMGVLPDPAGAYRQGEQQNLELQAQQLQIEAMRRQQATAVAEQQRTEAAQSIRPLIAKMIGGGQCREAVALALEYGQIALATEARGFCDAGTGTKQK